MNDEIKIPEHKGQFELDTDERTKEFYNKLSIGWEDEYKEYRRLWVEAPQKKEIREYPLLVDLELADVCNLKCPMCPTTTSEFKDKRRAGLMNVDLAKKIIDEIAGKVFALRLSWIGESTMHPDFIELIKYAKDRDIREVAFLTNGYKLDLDYFKQLVDAGADWITVSIDGIGETYSQIRKPLVFEDIYQKLKDIKKYKDENNLIKPVIKIQAIWPAIRENPTKYYNMIAPYVDLVAYNPLIDYLHKDDDIVYVDDFSCPQHYQRVVVASNGIASMCSSDDFVDHPIGDTNIQTIHEIWHGEAFNKMREIHCRKDGYMSIKACKNCFYPRATENTEVAQVNERTIYIENYINRKQKVGE
jgi:MoaA/NifB/PqqE/SkfB family radical SAM enzyme